VILAVGGGLAWKFGYLSSKHTAPNVSGLTLAEASTLVKNDGLTLSVTSHATSATIKAGDIVSQIPAAGTSVSGGATLKVVVSNGPPPVLETLPTNLVGMSCATAISTLATMHVTATCPATALIANSSVAKGLVAEVLYGTTKNPLAVPKGSSVILESSSGTTVVTTTTLPSTTTAPTTTAPTTTVPTTTAPTTTAPTTTTTTTPTTTTTLHATSLAMPNLVGMDQSQVAAAMKVAGLYYSTKGPGAGSATSAPTWTRVVSTVPASGTKVPYESTVLLNVTNQ
jgi:beta-lactam-binding protein with PASTA domain